MPKHKPLPPLERLNELLEIVPIAESQFGTHSGLVCKEKRRGTRGVGGIAGSLASNVQQPGRFDWKVRVDGEVYAASRLIYYMANGVDPGEFEVDHKDTNPFNNNAGNLRLDSENRLLQKHNKKVYSNNTSGVRNMYWDKKAKKWRSQLRYKLKLIDLGFFTCRKEAAFAINEKIIELELDKLGKPLNDPEAIECDCCNCQR